MYLAVFVVHRYDLREGGREGRREGKNGDSW